MSVENLFRCSSDCRQTVPKGFKTKAYSGWIMRSQRICAVCPPSVASGDSLPLVGPQQHSVAALKTPVAPGTVCAILFRHRGAVSSLQPKGLALIARQCSHRLMGSAALFRKALRSLDFEDFSSVLGRFG